jgi:hypothetical protein
MNRSTMTRLSNAPRAERRLAPARLVRRAAVRPRAHAVATPRAGRSQPAFRIEQEHAGGDDLVAFAESRPHFDAVGKLHAQGDGPGLVPIADGDEYVLLHAGIDHRVTRHGEHRFPAHLEDRVPVESRPERAVPVRDGHSHAQCAGTFGERRIDEVDARGEGRTAGRWEIQLRRRSHMDRGDVCFGNFG